MSYTATETTYGGTHSAMRTSMYREYLYTENCDQLRYTENSQILRSAEVYGEPRQWTEVPQIMSYEVIYGVRIHPAN